MFIEGEVSNHKPWSFLFQEKNYSGVFNVGIVFYQVFCKQTFKRDLQGLINSVISGYLVRLLSKKTCKVLERATFDWTVSSAKIIDFKLFW